MQKGDVIDLETYVHYSKTKKRTWRKIGATVAGLAIGSLPYLLDKKDQRQEIGKVNRDLLKVAAPLAGAGVASLPFVLKDREGRPISPHVTMPTDRNGLFVPNAYLKYNLYDSQGILVKSAYQMIDKQAKDAWQKLYLHEEVQEDGFVSIELGNHSKQPTWFEAFKLTKRTYMDVNDSDKPEKDMGPVTNADCWVVCVTTPYGTTCHNECGGGDGGLPPISPPGTPPGPPSNPCSSCGGGSPSPNPNPGGNGKGGYDRTDTRDATTTAYLPVEGVGAFGSYQIKASIHVRQVSPGEYIVDIGAIGKTISNIGRVEFWGEAYIIKNGQAIKTNRLVNRGSGYYQTGYQRIGTTSFLLSTSETFGTVRVKGGYVYIGPEGRASPYPSNTTIEFPIIK